MEKYGFVYIWYDRKHKRYYVGCHWGHEGDGYICSSSNMKSAYKRRPKDFRRRILKTDIIDRKDLLEEEYKWLSLIKKEELGKRYYNLHYHHFSHWSSDENSKLTVGQKISLEKKDKYKGKDNPFFGKKHSNETKKIIKEKRNKQIITEEHKKNIRNSHLGKNNHFYGKVHSDNTKELISNKIKELWKDPKYRSMMIKKHKINKEII